VPGPPIVDEKVEESGGLISTWSKMQRLAAYLKSCKRSFDPLPNPEWYVEKHKHHKRRDLAAWKKQVRVGAKAYVKSWEQLRPKEQPDVEGTTSTQVFTDEEKEKMAQQASLLAKTGKQTVEDVAKGAAALDFRRIAIDWMGVFRASSSSFLQGFREGKEEGLASQTNFMDSFESTMEDAMRPSATQSGAGSEEGRKKPPRHGNRRS
jgi:hypothetical protein